MSRITWDRYAIMIAEAAALRSEDPHRRVGAVVFRKDHTIAAVGYNGAPPGVAIDWSDREARRRYVVHAEVNALRYVVPGEASLVASTSMPCFSCVLQIRAYGITEIVYRDELDPEVYDVPAILDLMARCRITTRREAVS